jgi:hypothetical protein
VLKDDYLKRGYAVVSTDYQGLGGNGLHPFLQGIPAGRNGLDMLWAARELAPEIGTKFGANMQVRLTNDGPVTFWLES